MKAATGQTMDPAPAPPRTGDLARFSETCHRLVDHASQGRRGAECTWRAFADAAMQLFGSTRSAVCLRDVSAHASPVYLPLCTRGLTPHQQQLVASMHIPVGGSALLKRAELTLHPVTASAEDGDLSSAARSFGVRRLLLVPLATGRPCRGFFATDGGDVALHYPDACAHAVAEAARALSLALELAALRRCHDAQSGELALERGLSAVFAQATSLRELGAGVGEELRRVLAIDAVTVEWRLRGLAAVQRTPRTRAAVAAETLTVPFPHEGPPAGLLHLHGAAGRRGLQPRIRIAQDAAARAADVGRRLLQIAELERLTTRDPLTGLTNRREFVHRLDGELARARREGVPLTVVYLDLDDLKGLNDRVGHPTADVALCDLATRLRSRVRASDVVGRLGGDEFALILPHTSARGGLVLFGTLLEALREIEVDGVTGVLSVSGGLATYPEHGGDPDTLLRAADAALYAAKRRGKGGACVADLLVNA